LGPQCSNPVECFFGDIDDFTPEGSEITMAVEKKAKERKAKANRKEIGIFREGNSIKQTEHTKVKGKPPGNKTG